MRIFFGRRNTCFSSPLTVVLLSTAVVTNAQQYSNHEVAVALQAQTWGHQADNGFDHNLQYPTPTFSYTRNLSATLAVEGSVEPWTQFFRTNDLESGHETLALGGIKAGWRGKQWGFYGKTEAGIAS